ncbi:PPC domain-containing DNA-binding protein [Halanaerobacter jeridensis]|uniref:DNA-binding protein with PD1-like motif n=1 Tax=Halanaerobacter jeridensis TaxID=706427 RepID=A0A938XSA6_9FIRM|nr:PPC domain-containing DNA-binding protein [Halanaerobacter jeridensis]MBM7555904.1 putative DNA-binding protein with PD1-like motif [Halanaerobacter jeridensis]
MLVNKYSLTEIYQGRLETGDDLAEELTEFVQGKEIKAGKISAIGAVQNATISYYDQETKEYGAKEFDEAMEIVNLEGNISLKDGEPIVHAHIALADEEGNVYGGHLEEGTTVFACEFVIQEYDGEALERGFHEMTELPLWE